MTMQIATRLLALTCLVASVSAAAAVALFTLDELTTQSKTIFLVRVVEVRQPDWKDSGGANVALASAEVVRQLKGEPATRVVVAYLVNVSDQQQLEAGKQYLVFALGSIGPVYMGHQVRALPIAGEDVLITGLAGEKSQQPLSSFERRVRDAIRAR